MAISSEALDELEKTNPDLVAKYRARMTGSNQDVQQAQDVQDYGGIANVVGKNLTDLGNAFGGQSDVVLHNRMQDLGKAPTVEKARQGQYDSSAITNATSSYLNRAKEGQKKAEGDFWTGEKLADMQQSRADAGQVRADQAEDRMDKSTARIKAADAQNPASAESVAAREYLKQIAPGATTMAGFENLSAAQIQKISQPLFEKYKLNESIAARKDEARQRSADRIEAGKQRSADREAMAGMRRDDKADAKAVKDAEYGAAVKIPGLEVQPGYRPTVAGAAKVRESKIAHDDLTSALGDLDRIYASSGTNLVGEDSARQEQIVNSMRTKLKDLERLGALSSSDYALLDSQLPDPTSWKENAKGFIGQDRYQAKSDEFRKALKRSLDSTAANNGYSVSGEKKTTDGGAKGGVHGSDLPD